MSYLIIGLVLFVIFCTGITILTKAMGEGEKLTKQDKLIIAALSLSLSALSVRVLSLILNY